MFDKLAIFLIKLCMIYKKKKDSDILAKIYMLLQKKYIHIYIYIYHLN